MFKSHFLKKQKHSLKSFPDFGIYRKSSAFSKKKDQLGSLNMLEVIESGKCGYLNAWKLRFWNTLRESTCSRVPNIAEIYRVGIYLKFTLIQEEYS